jgi:general secretion pathway protein K
VKGEGGFALVLTLIITALLIALTTEFVNEVYVDTSASHNFVNGQQASLLADSGITGGIRLIQLSLVEHGGYTSFLDPWAQPLHLDDELGSLDITIEDESGKLNLNSVVSPNGEYFEPYHEMADRLFKKLKLSPDLLDALADWIDVNDEPRPSGAESPYYQGLKPPYSARNGPLATMEELRLVKGFDAATVDRLRPFVTFYPNTVAGMVIPININTAPQEVLAALDDGMSDSLVRNVLDYRKTTPFTSKADLAKVAGMDSLSQTLSTYITAAGGIFRITSRGQVTDTSRIIEAVVLVNAGQSTVLYWREY